MIGIVVVTHGNIGQEMVTATRRIIPEVQNLVSVAVESDDPPSSIAASIETALHEVHGDEGVLILTDIFGGTPANICLTFLRQPHVEIISGVNLPMLIKLASLRSRMNFTELIEFIQEYGKRNIVQASRVLAGTLTYKG